jgi:hypothetical protein
VVFESQVGIGWVRSVMRDGGWVLRWAGGILRFAKNVAFGCIWSHRNLMKDGILEGVRHGDAEAQRAKLGLFCAGALDGALWRGLAGFGARGLVAARAWGLGCRGA